MGQLHEVLSIDGDLKGEKKRIKEETENVFAKKPNLFSGFIKILEMFSDDRKEEEAAGGERKEIVTTVPQKLKYMSKSFTRFWDARLQKESANQEAKADILIEGAIFAKDVPVTFLLGMEEELKQLRSVYDAIPTLQPGMEWVRDTQKGPDYWKVAHPTVTSKGEKVIEFKIIVPPTTEHPAQVREWSNDKDVGRYVTENWSGMISPAEKSLAIGKIDIVLRAFKKARQRANNQETRNIGIGKKIFDYVHGDLVA